MGLAGTAWRPRPRTGGDRARPAPDLAKATSGRPPPRPDPRRAQPAGAVPRVPGGRALPRHPRHRPRRRGARSCSSPRPSSSRSFLDLDAWSRKDAFHPSGAAPARAPRAPALCSTTRRRPPAGRASWRRSTGSRSSSCSGAPLIVHDLEDDEDPEIVTRPVHADAGEQVYPRVHGSHGAEYVAVKGDPRRLYVENAFMATRLLSAIRSELDSALRDGAPLALGAPLRSGFPTLEEALSWFARPPAAPAAAHPGLPARPPGFWIAAHPGTGAARRRVRSSPQPPALEPQLVAAANAVLVADSTGPGDAGGGGARPPPAPHRAGAGGTLRRGRGRVPPRRSRRSRRSGSSRMGSAASWR